MNYTDGTEIQAGDRVLIDGDVEAIVIMDFDNMTAVEGYRVEEWATINSGVMLEAFNGALVSIDKTVNSRGSVLIRRFEAPK